MNPPVRMLLIELDSLALREAYRHLRANNVEPDNSLAHILWYSRLLFHRHTTSQNRNGAYDRFRKRSTRI